MNFFLNLGCRIAIAFGSMIAASVALNAMPNASLARVDTGSIKNVDWACGPGWHLNPWGRCVPDYWRRGGGWSHGYYGYPDYGGGGWHHKWHEHEH
jgi:hypothetical protein